MGYITENWGKKWKGYLSSREKKDICPVLYEPAAYFGLNSAFYLF